MNLLQTAYKLIDKGLCVISTNSEKQTFLKWAKYQQQGITKEEVAQFFEHPKAACLAIVCGPCSGNLEVVDIDIKYDLTGTLYDRIKAGIGDDLFGKLLVIRTRSGGYHLYYRCEVIEGNKKLALRNSTAEERSVNPADRVRVLIETRGERGYVIAPPSEGYKVEQRNEIPLLTIEERDHILSVCRSFNEVVEEVKFKPAKAEPDDRYTVSPWVDYDNRANVVDLLEKHGWKVVKESAERVYLRRPGKDEGISGDYHKEKNLFKSFSTSTVFGDEKAYTPSAVFALLECGGDFRASAKKLLEMGYGSRLSNYGFKTEKEIYNRKKDGQSKDEIVKALAQNGMSEEQAAGAVEELEQAWGPVICEFWDISEKGQIVINRRRLEQFLSNVGGFYLYFYDKNSVIYRLVKITNGLVEEVSIEHVKKFIKSYIENLPERFDSGKTPDELLEVIYKGSASYFSKELLEFLPRIELDLLSDSKTTSYFPFKNGVVEITKKNIRLLPYSEIGKIIWKSQVIDHYIIIDQDFEITTCEYFQFINEISGREEQRWQYAITLIGYLLHKYKDPAKPYAVILAEETEDEDKGGGTGKGIFVKALSYILNTERVDGKNFKLDKNFAFQRVGLDTRLVAIEDVRKNVDFEGFYSIITEGITVEKKNKDELFIPYEDSPKIIFTTNYTISQKGEHSKRRQKVFEFAPFFKSTYTPMDHFGHKLFDDWDVQEWGRFYNFLFMCVSTYMEAGVLSLESSGKMKRKHIRIKYGELFLSWFDGWIENGCEDFRASTKIYQDFLTESDLEKREFNQTKFIRGIDETVQMLHPLFRVCRERMRGDEGNKVYMKIIKQ